MRRLFLVTVLLLAAMPAWGQGCPARDPAGIARHIAEGHAWAKHGAEYAPGRVIDGRPYAGPPVRTADDFAGLVGAGIARPDAAKPLARGRRAYWEEDYGGVVIVDPRNPDCGTAFRPNRGRAYFDGLR
jgi:filamentous hemagglutinin